MTTIRKLSPAFEVYKQGTTEGWVTVFSDGWSDEVLQEKVAEYIDLEYTVRPVLEIIDTKLIK